MPFCPDCKFEYVDEIEKCPDCNMKLIEELPAQSDPSPINEEFVPIFSARDTEEAEVVKGVLLDAGIEVIEEKTLVPPMVYGNPNVPEALTVPASRADEARKVIEDALSAGEKMTEE